MLSTTFHWEFLWWRTRTYEIHDEKKVLEQMNKYWRAGSCSFGRLITGIKRNLVRIKSFCTLPLEAEDEHSFCSLNDVVRDQPGGRTLFLQFDVHPATSLAIVHYEHRTGKLWRQGHILIFWSLSTRMTLVWPLTANPRTAVHESRNRHELQKVRPVDIFRLSDQNS